MPKKEKPMGSSYDDIVRSDDLYGERRIKALQRDGREYLYGPDRPVNSAGYEYPAKKL